MLCSLVPMGTVKAETDTASGFWFIFGFGEYVIIPWTYDNGTLTLEDNYWYDITKEYGEKVTDGTTVYTPWIDESMLLAKAKSDANGGRGAKSLNSLLNIYYSSTIEPSEDLKGYFEKNHQLYIGNYVKNGSSYNRADTYFKAKSISRIKTSISYRESMCDLDTSVDTSFLLYAELDYCHIIDFLGIKAEGIKDLDTSAFQYLLLNHADFTKFSKLETLTLPEKSWFNYERYGVRYKYSSTMTIPNTVKKIKIYSDGESSNIRGSRSLSTCRFVFEDYEDLIVVSKDKNKIYTAPETITDLDTTVGYYSVVPQQITVKFKDETGKVYKSMTVDNTIGVEELKSPVEGMRICEDSYQSIEPYQTNAIIVVKIEPGKEKEDTSTDTESEDKDKDKETPKTDEDSPSEEGKDESKTNEKKEDTQKEDKKDVVVTPQDTKVEPKEDTTSKEDVSKEEVKEKTSSIKKVISIAKVSKVKLKALKKGKIKVSFKSVKIAKEYQVQYSTSKKFKSASIITTKSSSVILKKLKKKKTYYVKVRGINGDSIGKWSKVYKIKVK